MQIKSALDTMVKFPEPILGKKVWNVRTFGAKGKDVLNAMDRCVPRQYADRMAALRKMTFEKNTSWLESVIDARDRTNHFQRGGIHFGYFAVRKVIDENGERITVPMWSPDQTVRDLMVVLWRKLLCFVEEFLGMFFFLRIKPQLTFGYRHLEDEGVMPRWGIDLMGNFGPHSFPEEEVE